MPSILLIPPPSVATTTYLPANQLLPPTYLPTIQSINQPTNHFNQSTNQKPAVTCCSSLLSSRTHYLIMPSAFFCCCNLPTLLPTNQRTNHPTNLPNNLPTKSQLSLTRSSIQYLIMPDFFLPTYQLTNLSINLPTILPFDQPPYQPIVSSAVISTNPILH